MVAVGHNGTCSRHCSTISCHIRPAETSCILPRRLKTSLTNTRPQRLKHYEILDKAFHQPSGVMLLRCIYFCGLGMECLCLICLSTFVASASGKSLV